VNPSDEPASVTAVPRSGIPAAFGSRAISAVAITAAFAALAWADAVRLGGMAPAWWLLPLAVAFAVGGVTELVALFARRGVALPTWLLRPAVAGVVLSVAEADLLPREWPPAAEREMGWAAAAVALAIIGLCGVEIARYRPGGGALERLAAGSFTLVFVGLPLAFIVSLRLLVPKYVGPEAAVELRDWHDGAGRMLPLVSLVAVVKAGDIAAYVIGSACGRHPMTPCLSPGKTWEGAAASLTGSLAAAWIVLEWCPPGGQAGPWGGWAVYGPLVGLAGMLGDLAESLVKRECGVKDSGRSLGGLGGVLDLVDSLLFAAPVAWLLWVAGGR
jgi:phosphatidate cytidylyltransferase